jgi:hypothetical protein
MQRYNSLKNKWICLVCAGMIAGFVSGCAAAATPFAPAPAAPETAAPATAAPAAPAPMVTQFHTNNLPGTPTIPAVSQNDIYAQLQQIDSLLQQQIIGRIAYNTPESMNLGQTVTIELLLNPSLSAEQLGSQLTENGRVNTAALEITPQMKAVLLSPQEEAFTIQSMHEEIQLISASETTKWAWFVTAKQSGTQRLVLVIYRLVKYEGQDYWREVETYRADIKITVPFARWIQSIDWKWLTSIMVALLSLPFFWRWSARRRKNR